MPSRARPHGAGSLAAGFAYAYDRDPPATQAIFQEVNPFRDEEPDPVPPPGLDGLPPLPMPPDPGDPDDASLPLALPPLDDVPPDATPPLDGTPQGDCCPAAGDCESNCVGGETWCSRSCREGLLGIRFDGWISQGYTVNTDSPSNRSNLPVTFNDRSNDYQMNQCYLLMERLVNEYGGRWDVGGRVDLLYGTDSIYTTARGLETYGDLSPKWNSGRYGLAMPQCYMEVFVPWASGLSMKLGHFYTILGHESVPAVDNFFYSHSYVMQYGEPFTHTGFLGSTELGSLTVHAGMTRGWDNWEDNNNDFAFLGGLGWTSADGCTSLEYAVHFGREQDEPPPNTNTRSVFSLVAKHRFTSRLQYIVQYDHGFEEQVARQDCDADWFGVNQYLLYTMSSAWKAGLRFEWFRDEDGTRIDPAGADYYALSAGLNWTPADWILVRPEVRWDWVGTSGFYPFGDGRRDDQVLLDFDVIVRF